MLPFYILIFVPLFVRLFSRLVDVKGIDRIKKDKFALKIFFMILLVLLMFKHKTVGNDTMNYIYYFNKIASTELTQITDFSEEFGFVLFNKAISCITENPQFYLAVAAIIIVLLIAPTYVRLCEDPSLTIALFCVMSTFVMMFSGIRQMLAIGIGFVAYNFVRKKKFIPFVISVAVAVSFHTSALMLIFMYPLYHIKITKKWLYGIVPAMLLTFVFNKQIFTLLKTIIERYTRFDATITSTGAYSMIVLFALFGVFSFLIPDETKLDEETLGLRNFLIFAIFLQMFAPLHTLAMRMNYYYIIFIPLLIPKIIKYRNVKWGRIAVFSRYIMVAFFIIYFFMSASNGGLLNVFPYHFFWENL